EFDTFLTEVENDISGEDADPDKYINEYLKQIDNGDPEKALEILNEKEIPKNEELVEKYKDMEFDNEDLTELKEALTKILEIDKQKQETLRDIFEKVMDYPNLEDVEDLQELQIDKELETLADINEKTIEDMEDSAKIMKEVNEKYDQIDIDEKKLASEVDMDVSEMNEDTEMVIMAFIIGVADLDDEEIINSSTEDDEKDDSDEEEIEKETDSLDDELLKEMLADKGSTKVALDAEAEIKDNHFRLTGQSNLVEGSTVLMHTYHYGAEDAYFKGELEVDEDGSFELEEEINGEELNGEPLVIRLAFQPDKEDPEIQKIYGEEGEK